MGIKVNYQKSCLIPINIPHEKAINLARVFGCTIGSFPFTYRGLPLVSPSSRLRNLLTSFAELKDDYVCQFMVPLLLWEPCR